MEEDKGNLLKNFMSQAPEGLTEEAAKVCLERNEWDVVKALLDVWQVPEKPTKQIDPVQQAWNERRQVCDAYDDALQKHLKNNTAS